MKRPVELGRRAVLRCRLHSIEGLASLCTEEQMALARSVRPRRRIWIGRTNKEPSLGVPRLCDARPGRPSLLEMTALFIYWTQDNRVRGAPPGRGRMCG